MKVCSINIISKQALIIDLGCDYTSCNIIIIFYYYLRKVNKAKYELVCFAS